VGVDGRNMRDFLQSFAADSRPTDVQSTKKGEAEVAPVCDIEPSPTEVAALTEPERLGLEDLASRPKTNWSFDDLKTFYLALKRHGAQNTDKIAEALTGRKSLQQIQSYQSNWGFKGKGLSMLVFLQTYGSHTQEAGTASAGSTASASSASEPQEEREVIRSGRTRVEPQRFQAVPAKRPPVASKPDEPPTIMYVVESGQKYTVTESHSASFIKASVPAFKVSTARSVHPAFYIIIIIWLGFLFQHTRTNVKRTRGRFSRAADPATHRWLNLSARCRGLRLLRSTRSIRTSMSNSVRRA